MAKLTDLSAAHAALPDALTIGKATIAQAAPQALTWVAPFDGQAKPVSAALKEATGLTLPRPGKTSRTKNAMALWWGPDQAMLVGATAKLDGAATVDQTSAWASIDLTGADARTVLERLTPLDVRDTAFPVHATARTLIGHMTASLTRTDKDSYRLMVFRSMAVTLVHDLTRSMTHVAGRANL
ncbi:sarcosine oxidase subunit gamma [Roseibium sp.]|uniref:sarcosine oxidase subunit gamma n=1 Tax=Roseibium sp. TaxID=1936156 RepID=UPI003D10ECCA